VSAPSRPVESLLARLEGVRRQNGFYRAFCPAHDDRKTPNLDIKEGEDGRVLLLCRAGCVTEEVVEALGNTAVSTGLLSLKKPGEYLYLRMGEDPFGAEGHTVSRGRPPYRKLGREISSGDLPEGSKNLMLDTYRKLWNL
jgi:hypothetical protein